MDVAASNPPATKVVGTPPPSQTKPNTSDATHDPFDSPEPLARICARFITHLFACPVAPARDRRLQSRLDHFIAYTLRRTNLAPPITFASLILLQRLKFKFPTTAGNDGHRLFITAFMISSKVFCDHTFSNESWRLVSRNMFTLKQLNRMEREMCNYLDWNLNVDAHVLANFEVTITSDFHQYRPQYPRYSPIMLSHHNTGAQDSKSMTEVVTEAVSTGNPQTEMSVPINSLQQPIDTSIITQPVGPGPTDTARHPTNDPTPSVHQDGVKADTFFPGLRATDDCDAAIPLRGRMYKFASGSAF
ncbi:hypothetical protein D9611_000662 [Ephemerocybe angulata]|uniref:Cyclin N-terminal domain-containing protein n=1 Tax=Ephemerocybe angulata TaxID=980116 RepID=A0A8H5BMC3_9AGAR|nr:hypothetical protein D9611_000662 [Tulosesus angulatus]